jgi:hypothetical protein
MLLTAHQPNYLPYLGFFHKIALADRFVVADTVQFVKRGPFGWIHRNKIRTAEGWQWLSVPVHTKGKFTQRICDTMIRNDLPWGRKHWKALVFNYRKAPHFERYAPRLEAIYARPWEKLGDLNEALIRLMLEFLQIERPILRASQEGIQGKATELIVNLCRAAGTDRYLSGVHGRDYLDPARLEEAGIHVTIQPFTHPTYPQCQPGPFVPNLTALDLLFNVGPGSRAVLMGGP